MNRLRGHITGIENNGGLTIVGIDIGQGTLLKSIIIETPDTADYLVRGKEINVLFKETEVVIGTSEKHRISLQNKIPGIIENIEKGELISKITVKSTAGNVDSIISTNAVKQLELIKGLPVVAMIKLNEVMLSQ